MRLDPELVVSGTVVGPPDILKTFLGDKPKLRMRLSAPESSRIIDGIGVARDVVDVPVDVRGDGVAHFEFRSLWKGELEIQAAGRTLKKLDVQRSVTNVLIDLNKP